MTDTSFLSRMGEASRARVRRARAQEPESRLLSRALATPMPPPLRLETFDVIAELKLRSPAAGSLAPLTFDRAAQIETYARAGAAAISVLTEPAEFHGHLDHLREAAERLGVGRPVMRKDFLTDPYQIIEARAAGAGGVLVIVGLLDDAELDAMLACARDLRLFVLLEAFDADDVARIARLDIDAARHTVLAGVNSRNLKNLEVDVDRFAALAPLLPPHLPAVAESGIGDGKDVRRVAALGYRLVLVGAALMRTGNPAALLGELLAAGRAAVPGRHARCS
jgi:indole-3-glycerol phosphate synthase